jgi:hypothetical protein
MTKMFPRLLSLWEMENLKYHAQVLVARLDPVIAMIKVES